MFQNFNDEVAQEENRLGGGRQLKESGVYRGKVKMAYGDAYDSGAQFMRLVLELEDGSEYSETITLTNKAGQNTYTKDGVTRGLPGYTIVNDLCLLSAGANLSDLGGEEKSVLVYDFDLQKEVPQMKYVVTALIGKDVAVTIRNLRKNKMKKNEATGKWDIPTKDEALSNEIHTVFHPETGFTAVEMRNQVEEPAFLQAWVEKYAGHVFDSYKEVSESGGAFGAKGGAGTFKSKSGNPFAKKA